MSDRHGLSKWLSDSAGLALLAFASAVLAALIVLPYVQYVLLGAVLAYIFAPAQRRLERYVRSGVAALVLVAVAILAIILPTMYLLAVALREALEVVAAVQDGQLSMGDIERQLEAIGYAGDMGDLYDAYQEPISTGIQGLASSALGFIGGLPNILIGLTVTLFVLFGLLRDRRRFLAWVRWVLPVEEELQRELFAEIDQLMWASVVGNVAVAAIQAVLLGIGLYLLGVPAVAFLTVATFVLALLPLVGAFGVWVPVTIYLLIVGRPVAAAMLVVYGSLVSASDTYLRPALIGRTSAFNSAIVVVGIFGGLVVFGAVGLFIGPVVLGGAKVTLDVFAEQRAAAMNEESHADPQTVADSSRYLRIGGVPGVDTASSGVQDAVEESETSEDNGDGTASENSDIDSSPETDDDRR
ncbi:AI-2E family transporter [Halobacteria archaeon AArc-dxtr1]|nr:AI-2E family transporter [Halobacteria archaeon AArc-dxtr1]